MEHGGERWCWGLHLVKTGRISAKTELVCPSAGLGTGCGPSLHSAGCWLLPMIWDCIFPHTARLPARCMRWGWSGTPWRSLGPYNLLVLGCVWPSLCHIVAVSSHCTAAPLHTAASFSSSVCRKLHSLRRPDITSQSVLAVLSRLSPEFELTSWDWRIDSRQFVSKWGDLVLVRCMRHGEGVGSVEVTRAGRRQFVSKWGGGDTD